LADYLSEFTRELVRKRAGNRCEYCPIHQYTQSAAFHIDHVIPANKGGKSVAHNLALACPHCDRQKWDFVEAPVPAANRSAPLFNPRTPHWADHFVFWGYRVVGITPTGKATAELLKLNHEPKVRVREIEQSLGLFPPDAQD